MGPAFLMKGSSLSNARIGSVAMVSHFSRAPLVALPWFARWMISPKWAVSPLMDRPFSCLTGWTPLTTCTEGLLKRGDTEGNVVIVTTGQGYSYTKWVIPPPSQLQESQNLPQETCWTTKCKHFKKPNHSIAIVYYEPESCGPSCTLLRFTTPSFVFWHRDFILFMVVLHQNEHKETFKKKFKKLAIVLPFFDISLSIFCLVIWQVHLRFWLIFNRP